MLGDIVTSAPSLFRSVITDDLTYKLTVSNIMREKATYRLYFLKQLKRAGLSNNHLLHYYTSVIRPGLEYSAPVWHYALTKEQTYQIERIQKRAIHIIFNFPRSMPYTSMLHVANLDTLATRRNDLSQKNLFRYYTALFLSSLSSSSHKRSIRYFPS